MNRPINLFGNTFKWRGHAVKEASSWAENSIHSDKSEYGTCEVEDQEFRLVLIKGNRRMDFLAFDSTK